MGGYWYGWIHIIRCGCLPTVYSQLVISLIQKQPLTFQLISFIIIWHCNHLLLYEVDLHMVALSTYIMLLFIITDSVFVIKEQFASFCRSSLVFLSSLFALYSYWHLNLNHSHFKYKIFWIYCYAMWLDLRKYDFRLQLEI